MSSCRHCVGISGQYIRRPALATSASNISAIPASAPPATSMSSAAQPPRHHPCASAAHHRYQGHWCRGLTGAADVCEVCRESQTVHRSPCAATVARSTRMWTKELASLPVRPPPTRHPPLFNLVPSGSPLHLVLLKRSPDFWNPAPHLPSYRNTPR